MDEDVSSALTEPVDLGLGHSGSAYGNDPTRRAVDNLRILLWLAILAQAIAHVDDLHVSALVEG